MGDFINLMRPLEDGGKGHRLLWGFPSGSLEQNLPANASGQ